jgi:hypothetical protein
MNSATPPCIERRIGTTIAAAAVIALSALIAPTQAFATPTPSSTPNSAAHPAKAFGQTSYTNIATISEGKGKPGDDWDDDEYSSDGPMW